MNFFERYEQLCTRQGLKPISEQAAKMIGVERATISIWKKRGFAPKAETVAQIADVYGVSTDYLLGRTDDPTDYTNPDLIAELAGPQLEAFDGDVKKAVALQRATAEDVRREKEATPRGVTMYERLDAADREKTEIFMQALLTHEKYSQQDRKKHA